MSTRLVLVLVFVALLAVATAIDLNEDMQVNDESPVERRQIKQCRDVYPWCPNYKILCRLSPCIRNECARTCGLCVTAPPPTTQPTQAPLPACKHSKENPSCPGWQRRGYCDKKHIYYPYMKAHCPAACGFCRLPTTATQSPQGAHSVTVNINECLQTHNTLRARHQSPPLTWDSNIARSAQAWALKLAKIKQMKFESGIKYGEILAYQRGGSKYTCKMATELWYKGEKDYDYKNPGFSQKTGTFTQVVWKSSRRLGVGIAKNGDFIIVVGRYDPRGNYAGQFPANVLPPKNQG